MKKDRISQLPDSLIFHILDHLSTRESVKTSVLSSRWKDLWLWISSLKLDSQNFQDLDAFVSFGDRFFDSNRVAYLQKLDLTIDGDKKGYDDVSYLTAWMDAVAKRKIQHLEFACYGDLEVHTNQLSLYKCETLVYLDLYGVIFDDAEFLSFPCLKTMHLTYVSYSNNAAFEKLLSRCLVLEELQIYFDDDDKKGLQVHSRSLKKLYLTRAKPYSFEPIPGLVIDTPLLCDLRILDDNRESIIVNNWQSNAKLDITVRFGSEFFNESKRSNIRSFLSGISRVGHMNICADTFKSIFQYSKVAPLPQFGYMSRLVGGVYASDLKRLPNFFESCPNLKFLHLFWQAGNEEMSQMSFSSVPKCLQSSLEFIKIVVPYKACAAEMKIVRYLLENSAVLKKFTLSLAKINSWTQKYIHEDLPKIPRGSTKCEADIIVR